MRRAGVLLLLASLAGCGSGSTTTTSAPAAGATAEQTGPVVSHIRHVTVHETEFTLDPVNASAGKEGLVSITIVNDGKVAHALAVDGPNGEVELDGQIDPGHTGKLQVDLDRPGTYTWYCPLDGHRAKGMRGTISVGGTQPARGAEPTGTTPTRTTTATQTTPTQTQTQTRTVTKTQTQTRTTTTPTTTTGSGY
ncbi:MAG: cupredoxin domain-containing protein [Thermoleophilaceae bacterium]